MSRYLGPVAGHHVDALAAGLSMNPNTGKVIAEQLLREEDTRRMIMTEIAKKPGSDIAKEAKMLLPPLIGGGDWADLFDLIREE